ncbi:hypothetical protein, partial [Acetobacter sp.]|uniref:hypothetical protein n=1 Tax=Acetobacter sp. TaxID=440 RepID=UPI0039ECE743
LQLIAKPAQPSKALFNIKKTRLLHLPYPNQYRSDGITQRGPKPESFSNPPRGRLLAYGIVLLEF